MNGYRFFASLRALLSVVAFVLIGVFACGAYIYNELSTEAGYRARLGADWRASYERVYGSLATARVKVVVCAIGIVVICALAVWIHRLLLPARYSRNSARGMAKRPRPPRASRLDRPVRLRRNAAIGIMSGLGGIAAGVLLVLFRFGIFADHADESALGIFVFVGGYLGVLAGCRWWLKAKEWNDAVVFIGLMPLAILFVPFVRLIFVAAPALLPTSMVMMPLILIVVVFVLPDKSGWTGRRRR